MNQPRLLFKNTTVLAVSRLVERLSSFVLAFFISRTLGASGLGIYATTMAFYALMGLAGDMGGKNLMVREVAKQPEKTSRFIVHLSTMTGSFSAALVALAVIVLPYLGYSPEMTAGMYVIILAVVPATLNAIQESVFVAHQKVEFVTYTTFIGAVVNVGTSLYLLATGHDIVSLLITFVGIQYFITVLYFFFISRYITPLRWEFKLSYARTLLGEMKTFTASSLLGGFFARPEILILSLLAAEAQVGYYSAALKVVDLWYLIPQTFMINVFPLLSRSYHVADRRSQVIMDKSAKYLLAISLPLTAGIIVAAEPIVRLLYGPGFGPTVDALRILAFNIPIYSLHSILWRVLSARNEQGAVLRVQAITLFVRLGSGYGLISILGYLGAAISTPANLLLHNGLLALAIKRDGTQLRFLRLGWRFGLASAGMAAVTWALLHYVNLLIVVPLSAAIYVTLVILLRAFSPDDFALFRRIWRSGIARVPGEWSEAQSQGESSFGGIGSRQAGIESRTMDAQKPIPDSRLPVPDEDWVPIGRSSRY